MSNVIRLRNRHKTLEEIRDESGVHLARLERGATEAERKAIEEWLREDPRHGEVFLHMAKLWDEMSLLAGLGDVFPLEARERRRAGAGRMRWASLAACLVLVAGLVIWAVGDGPRWLPARETGQYQAHHETAVGDQSTVNLPDGTAIILNTDTVLDVAFTRGARNVFLQGGEAFFTVEPDSGRPFRVYAGDRVVEVVGTAFLVRHDGTDDAQVIVREGRINFHRVRQPQTPQDVPDDIDALLLRDETVSLVAGDVLDIDQDNLRGVVRQRIEQAAMESKLAWMRGMLVFEGETLQTVLREVSRYTTVTLEADAAIRDIEVQGYFRAGDIDGLLVAMKRNFNIEATRVDAAHIRLHPEE